MSDFFTLFNYMTAPNCGRPRVYLVGMNIAFIAQRVCLIYGRGFVMTKFVSTLIFLLVATSANAGIIGYDFEWAGSDGYSMTGMFTFDEADAADGAIRDGEVASLMFDGLLNGVLFASNSTAHLLPDFNFNFDATAGQFFLDGGSTGDSGQRWNAESGRVGLTFGAGDIRSALSLDGGLFLGTISNPTPLTASAKVPTPATLALFGLGLAGLGWSRHKKA